MPVRSKKNDYKTPAHKRAVAALKTIPRAVKNEVSSATRRDIMNTCRSYTQKAIKTLVEIMDDPKEDARARIAAVKILLDRGYGQAPKSTVHIVAGAMNREQLEEAARLVLEKRARALTSGNPNIIEASLNDSARDIQ